VSTKRSGMPVSARKITGGWLTNGIDFNDFGRMQVQSRSGASRKLPVPNWAVNDRLLRDLIVTFMEERAGWRKESRGPKGGELTLKERLSKATGVITGDQRPRLSAMLDERCMKYVKMRRRGMDPGMTDEEINQSLMQRFMPGFEPEARHVKTSKKLRALEIEIESIDTYLRITANGGADVIAGVVYLYYRMGMDSVNVGAVLGLKPPHCRQILYRLHRTWERRLSAKYSVKGQKPKLTPFDLVAEKEEDCFSVTAELLSRP